MTCITYLCVCNNNNRNESSPIIHQEQQQQQQQSSPIYPVNHHNYQNWTGLQNYNLLQQGQLPEPPMAIPISIATTDFGPYVGGPQPASVAYCQPSTSTAITTSINDLFQLQVEHSTPSHHQETIVSTSTFLKSTSRTFLELINGNSDPNCTGNNSSNANWHHYQPSATDDYNNQHYQQNCNSSDNDGGIDIPCSSDAEVADGIDVSDGFQNYAYLACKTEYNNDNEQSGPLTYPMSQDVDYYAQFSSVAMDYKENGNISSSAISNSMDFIGDSTNASLPSSSSNSSVSEFIEPTNNNYYNMDAYSGSENNAAVFNEYNMNNWTSMINMI